MNMNLTFTKPTIQNRTPVNFPLYTLLLLYFTLTYNGWEMWWKVNTFFTYCVYNSRVLSYTRETFSHHFPFHSIKSLGAGYLTNHR